MGNNITVEPQSTKLEFRLITSSNDALGVLGDSDDNKLWLWSWLEISFNVLLSVNHVTITIIIAMIVKGN